MAAGSLRACRELFGEFPARRPPGDHNRAGCLPPTAGVVAASVHLRLHFAEAVTIEVELHVGVIGKKRHRHGSSRAASEQSLA